MVEIQTDNEETDDFRKMSTTSQRAKYEKRVQNTDEALQIIDKYAPEEKSIFASLEGRQEASEADIQEIIAGRWDYNRKVKKIQEISKDIAGCEAGIVKCQVAIDGLAPWLNMDIPINTTGTEKTDVMIGTMPQGLTETDIQGYISSAEPEIASTTHGWRAFSPRLRKRRSIRSRRTSSRENKSKRSFFAIFLSTTTASGSIHATRLGYRL